MRSFSRAKIIRFVNMYDYIWISGKLHTASIKKIRTGFVVIKPFFMLNSAEHEIFSAD